MASKEKKGVINSTTDNLQEPERATGTQTRQAKKSSTYCTQDSTPGEKTNLDESEDSGSDNITDPEDEDYPDTKLEVNGTIATTQTTVISPPKVSPHRSPLSSTKMTQPTNGGFNTSRRSDTTTTAYKQPTTSNTSPIQTPTPPSKHTLPTKAKTAPKPRMQNSSRKSSRSWTRAPKPGRPMPFNPSSEETRPPKLSCSEIQAAHASESSTQELQWPPHGDARTNRSGKGKPSASSGTIIKTTPTNHHQQQYWTSTTNPTCFS